MAAAMGAERQGALPQSISGISIDSRTIAPGEAFFAITGDRRDGHEFVAQALAAKAALAVVAADRRAQFAARCAAPGRARRARGFARARRRRARAHARQGDRRHRLGRQDRHQGSVAARAVERRRNARVGRLLQQSLGRAAVARALPGERALRRVRNGHEPRRRDRAAVAPGPPACRDHHHDRAGASGILGTLAKIADAKAEIFLGLEPDGAAVLNARHCRNSTSSSAAPRRPASRASSRSASTRRPTRG